MSVLEIQDEGITRIFDSKDPLPAPWDPVRAIRDIDVEVIDLHSGTTEISEEHHKVVEGIGWLMLAHSD